MKIILVHSVYRTGQPSGENVVFEAEAKLLRSRGHEVLELTKRSDELASAGFIGALRGAVSTPWNPFAAEEIRRVVKEFQPNIVHVHNVFPRFSPSVFYGAAAAARVLTLHNYRIFCCAAIPLRNGRTCTECLDRHSVQPALLHGCYRNSRLATLPIAAGIATHRALRTWERKVDAFVTLTDFQRRMMVDAGLPAQRVHIKPNFYPGTPRVIPWYERDNYVVFAGRLSSEKGIQSLLRAWRIWGAEAPELRIIGDGPLSADVRRTAENAPIRILGARPHAETERAIARARLLIVPSECFEGFPMVIREAFAFGTPVATSNIGPLPSIVDSGRTGIVFEPRDPESLLNTVRRAWHEPNMLKRMGCGARSEFEKYYTEEANYSALLKIYQGAIREHAYSQQ